jgi:hypothetical protein
MLEYKICMVFTVVYYPISHPSTPYWDHSYKGPLIGGMISDLLGEVSLYTSK